jgi:hypothetical protein
MSCFVLAELDWNIKQAKIDVLFIFQSIYLNLKDDEFDLKVRR